MALLLCVAVAASHLPWEGGRLHEPMSIAQAKRIHRQAMRHGREKAASHGHKFAVDTSGATEQVRRAVEAFNPGHAISPLDFGADPTGVRDSTEAVLRAVRTLLSLPNTTMADNIRDMGGATLDLRGGRYLISSPVVIPTFYGNLRITRGTLKASDKFPSNAYLLTIGADDCKADNQGCCNEEVSVTELMFDCSHVALGGIYVSHTMGTVVTDSFFTGYQGFGVHVRAGHELMVSYSWFSSYYWSQHHPGGSDVAIQIDGNDNYVTDVIVFDYSKTGIVIMGSANVLTGVHTWNGGGIGILVGDPTTGSAPKQTRLLGCYLDCNTLTVYNPAELIVTDTFFLVTSFDILGTSVKEVRVTQNDFARISVPIVLKGNFTEQSVSDVVVSGLGCKVTTATKTVALKAGSQTVDFSDVLVFPWIRSVSYSVTGSDVQSVKSVEVHGTSVVVTGTAGGQVLYLEVSN